MGESLDAHIRGTIAIQRGDDEDVKKRCWGAGGLECNRWEGMALAFIFLRYPILSWSVHFGSPVILSQLIPPWPTFSC